MLFCQSKCLNFVHQLIDVRTADQGRVENNVLAGESENNGLTGGPRSLEEPPEGETSQVRGGLIYTTLFWHDLV